MQLIDLSGQAAAAAASGAMTGLAFGGVPAALLDVQGRVSQMNALGEALVGAGLNLRRRRLTAVDAASNGSLQALIVTAVDTDAGSALEPVTLLCRDRRPLVVKAVPLHGLLAAAFGDQRVLLLFSDAEMARIPNRQVLARAFDLTPREADVAALVVAGEATDEIADRLGLKISSVRQLIKSILAKTDTRRQGELAALLSRFVLGHGGDLQPALWCAPLHHGAAGA